MPEELDNWKTKTYITGTLVGTALGLVASFLYARAAEEDAEEHGTKPTSIGTLQLIGLFLSVLGLIRQIAEMGKSPKKK